MHPRIRPPAFHQSSFHYFVQRRRQEYEEQNGRFHPQEFRFRDFIYCCSNIWSKMSEDERKPFLLEAQKDKERYEREMEQYKQHKGVPMLPRFVRPKQPYQPYYYFFHNEKSKLQAEFPYLGLTQIGKFLENKWMSIDSEARMPFEKIAKEDAQRYERECKEFEKNCKEFPERAPYDWKDQYYD